MDYNAVFRALPNLFCKLFSLQFQLMDLVKDVIHNLKIQVFNCIFKRKCHMQSLAVLLLPIGEVREIK